MTTASVAVLCEWRVSRRLLGFDEALRPAGGEPEIICLTAGPISIGYKEPVGVAFHTKILMQAGLYVYPEEEGATSGKGGASTPQRSTSTGGLKASASGTSLDSDQPPPGVNWKGSKKKKQKKKEGSDLYALLGLANERWTATEKQLKDAYRAVCLQHHPDKKLAGVTDEVEKARVEEYFKQIQDAYATLSDPAKRREYDSVDEFDDSLPLDCAAADFFKVFGPAFRRNSRWSVMDNVPDLGDETSSWADVDKFYNFWFSFKSWREFPHPDEEDVEGAESREHRRWIDRNNSKLREKGKKEEGRRLREFVEAAYRVDPRVVAKKEEEKAERERKKQEKEDARRRAEEEEAAKKAAEEAAKKAAEDAAKKAADEAKKAKEAAKKATKKERQRLRLISDSSEGVERLVCDDDVEKLCASLPLEKLQALNEDLFQFGVTREQQRERVLAELRDLLGAAAAEEAAKELKKRQTEEALKNAAKRDHAKKLEAMREWSDEELRMLDKAVAKYPQGTPKRWDAVAAYVRTRTLDEVLLMVKEKQGMSATRVKAQEDFRAGMKKRAEVQSQADLRVNAFTDVNVNLAGAAAEQFIAPEPVPTASSSSSTAAASAQQSQQQETQQPAVAAAAQQQQQEAAQPAASNGSTATAAAVPPAATASTASSNGGSAGAGGNAAAPVANGSSKKAAAVEQPAAAAAVVTAAAPATAPAPAAGQKKVVSADSGEWTEEQELALVKALKQFGKELGTERWEKVSSVVPGKTKAQCFKRFKELKEAFKAKKGAGGGADDGDD